MNQVVQNEQTVEERAYRKNRRRALILWGVLAVITITVTMLVPKVETEYLIAQGHLILSEGIGTNGLQPVC